MDNKIRTLPFTNKRYLDLIQDCFLEGKYVQTIKMIEEYEIIHPGNFYFSLLASICHFELGEEDEAKDRVDSALCLPIEKRQIGLKKFKEQSPIYEFLEEWSAFIETNFPENKEMIELVFVSKKLKSPNLLNGSINRDMIHFANKFITEDEPVLQLQWLQNTPSVLPSQEFSSLANQFLSHPQKNPIVKTGFIQWLLEKQMDIDIVLVKDQQRMEKNVVGLPEPLGSKFDRRVVQQIQKNYDQDPFKEQLMLETYRRYVMVYYPFHEEEIDLLLQGMEAYMGKMLGEVWSPDIINSRSKKVFEHIMGANEYFQDLSFD